MHTELLWNSQFYEFNGSIEQYPGIRVLKRLSGYAGTRFEHY